MTKTTLDDIGAEEAFLSCAIGDPDVIIECDFVRAEWFTWETRRDILSCMQTLAEDNINFAQVETLQHALQQDCGYTEAEALSATVSLAALEYVPAHLAMHYADRLQVAHEKRLISQLSQKIAQAAHSDDLVSSILSQAQSALDDVQRIAVSSRVTPLTTEYLMTTDFPEPVWIVKEILPAGLAFLAGKPKVGKSWLCLDLAHAVGCAGVFMGAHVDHGKVLYLALEDSPRRLASRMKMQKWNKAASVRFVTPDQGSIIGPLEAGGTDKILSLIAAHKFKLVIIDTLTRAIDSDQFSPQDMKRILSPLQEGGQSANCCILVVDHMPKLSGTEENVINDVYGSISKVGIADTILGFYRDRGASTGKLAGIGRDINEFSYSLKFFEAQGRWLPVDDHVRARYTEQRHAVLEYVSRVQDCTVTHCAVELGINKGTASKTLLSLKDDRLLLALSSGRRLIYQATPAGRETLARWDEQSTVARQMVGAV